MKNFVNANKTNILTIGVASSLLTVIIAVASLVSEISPAVIL